MTADAAELTKLFDSFTPELRRAVWAQFDILAATYQGGSYSFMDLWLAAISDIRDDSAMAIGSGPWL